jgi:ADP-ribose pyrophosphatase
LLYDGAILKIRRDNVRLCNGRVASREVVEHRGSVVILALEPDGTIPFVRQWRGPARRPLLELPAGTLEIGEDPAIAAARELEEEVGLRPGELTEVHRFWISPGWTTEYMHGYIARNCARVDPSPDEDEFFVIERYTLGDSMRLITEGEIEDAKTLLMLQSLAFDAVGPLGVKVVRSYQGHQP